MYKRQLLLLDDGTISCPGGILNAERVVTSDGNKVKLLSYLKGKKVADIAATKDCFIFLLEDGEVLVQGASRYGETDVPVLPAGEKLVSISAGANHIVGISDAGTVYAWGSDSNGQCKVAGKTGAAVYAGAYQSYVVDENGKLLASSGMSGYLFGTDSNGRDTFTRIVHGGKMTMTIGAVAVIVSSVIAIIVGCLSGYFGGWVDMVLMRITEIAPSASGVDTAQIADISKPSIHKFTPAVFSSFAPSTAGTSPPSASPCG